MKNKLNFKIIFNKIAAKRFSKKEKIVLLILFFVFSLYLMNYINDLSKSLKQEVQIIEPLARKYTPKATIKITEKIKHAIIESTPFVDKPKIRDPFLPSKDMESLKPKVEKKIPKINLALKGILWDKHVPSAIINSKVVKIGDLIYGKTVVDIEKDSVILMENGEIIILKLKKK